MIKKIIEFIISVFTYKTEAKKEEPVINDLKVQEETKEEKPIINQEEVKQPIKQPETTQKEVYVMLTNKERQTYLKKLGLYTKSIDNIRGSGQKKAEKQFNIIFLNRSNDTYNEETDKLLREIYKSYVASPYMTSTDWQYFKNFKKSEYKCKCKGKYCNGFPSEVSMRLVMLNQYIRNRIKASVVLTSGVRCQKHNDSLKGSVKNSKHLKGRASDLNGKGKTANELMKIAKEIPYLNYTYQCGTNEIHIDMPL